MRFERVENLLLITGIILPVALFLLLLRWKRKTTARIGDPLLVKQLVRNFSPFRFLVKFLLLLLAFISIVAGAANLQKQGTVERVSRRGVDVMLLLDVSKSMLAEDIKPSRLEKAKQLLNRLSDKLDNDRLGLVLFAGRAYLQMPLTTDHGATKMYIQNSGPDVVPTQGTVIGEALKMANTSFNSKERKYKAIVLISDGEDHDPDALKTAKELAANGVMINTVGIGSPDGSPIIDPATKEEKKDEQGNIVISKLNEAELQQLADATNGRYLRLDNMDDAVITLTQQLESIEKKSLNDSQFVDYKSYFQWFLGLAFLILLLEYFLPERRNTAEKHAKAVKTKTIAAAKVAEQAKAAEAVKAGSPPEAFLPMATRILVILTLLSGGVLRVSAQEENGLIRSGNRYYKDKKIDQSQQQYQQALHAAPDNPAANYNLGNTLFRKNNFEEAEKSYETSIEKSTDRATKEKGYYNKGVALSRQQKLEESIEAWKNALRLDPADKDARENLQKALMEKKQKDQQQKDQKDQKDKKDPQDKKDKKDQKDKKDKKDPKDKKDQPDPQQPKQQPSKLNKQQVEQLLQALQQKEKEVQEKMNQNKVKSLTQPDKDW